MAIFNSYVCLPEGNDERTRSNDWFWMISYMGDMADMANTHRIHGAGIYANIWGILMVNDTIYR